MNISLVVENENIISEKQLVSGELKNVFIIATKSLKISENLYVIHEKSDILNESN